MTTKLIALTITSLFAMPAFAQSHVSLSGVLDLGFSHYAGSSSHKNRMALDNNQYNVSRIAFKGVEDLGNGLKASFVLEYGIQPAQNATFFRNRKSFLTLSGGFGAVSLGTQNSLQSLVLSDADPFEDGSVAAVSNGYLESPSRINNSFLYVTPDMGGFSIAAMYSANALGDESATAKTSKSDDRKFMSIRPEYRNGPVYVGFSIHRIKKDASRHDNTAWDLGASYNFTTVKLAALYGQNKIKENNVDLQRLKQWMIGATAPVSSAGSVMASYVNFKDSETGKEGNKIAMGYVHSLSKRTAMYAFYAKTSKDLTLEIADGSGYNKGLNLGIRHRF